MSFSFPQNASQTSLDHFVGMKRQRQSFSSSREAFHDYSHMKISCLTGVQHDRSEDNSVSISFPQNASQSCCLTLLDHFVVIKRQRQSFSCSREAVHDYSHMIISCLIGVQHARSEDNRVGISFPQNTSQCCYSSLLDHCVVIKRQRQSFYGVPSVSIILNRGIYLPSYLYKNKNIFEKMSEYVGFSPPPTYFLHTLLCLACLVCNSH